MSKGTRLKAERAAAREAARVAMEERAPVAMLLGAVKVISRVFNTEPECAHAAAFLKLTAQHLGYELTPRTVSLVVEDRNTESKFFMGPRSDAFIREEDRGKLEVHLPAEGDTGHMVLTSDDPRMLFDANLPQLQRYGIMAEHLVLPIASTDPPDREWRTTRSKIDLLYLLDDNPALWETYEDALVDFARKAEDLAVLLREGTRPELLRLGPGPRT